MPGATLLVAPAKMGVRLIPWEPAGVVEHDYWHVALRIADGALAPEELELRSVDGDPQHPLGRQIHVDAHGKPAWLPAMWSSVIYGEVAQICAAPAQGMVA